MAWLATDLDRTLLSRDWGSANGIPATWREGERGEQPSSWMTRETFALLETLQSRFAIVAVTARDMDSFRRVRVEGIRLGGPAVIANGATILGADGAPDADWEQRMQTALAPWSHALETFREVLEIQLGPAIRARLVFSASGTPSYLVAKANADLWRTPEVRDRIAAVDWRGCTVSTLGAELQVVPPPIGKSVGLLEVARRWFGGEPPVIALGDMRADLPFMRHAHWLAAPRGSDLDEAWA